MERRYFDRRFQHQAVIWTSTDPQRAIDLSLADATRPDVLVVDMSLEGMGGAQVCRAIRTRTATIALLGVTSFSLRMYGPDALANGAQCLISKVPLR